MQIEDKHRTGSARFWTRIAQRLVYFPGALVLLYGFWLSLST